MSSAWVEEEGRIDMYIKDVFHDVDKISSYSTKIYCCNLSSKMYSFSEPVLSKKYTNVYTVYIVGFLCEMLMVKIKANL